PRSQGAHLDTATNGDIEWRSAGLRPGVSGSGSRKGAGPEAGTPLAVSRCARSQVIRLPLAATERGDHGSNCVKGTVLLGRSGVPRTVPGMFIYLFLAPLLPSNQCRDRGTRAGRGSRRR